MYVDYVILRKSYDESLRQVKEILDRKEEAFTRTLPSAIRYDLLKVLHSAPDSSPLDDYIMSMEKYDEQLRAARFILMERKELLDLKEEELRKSHNTTNRVFAMRYIDDLKVNQIARKLSYQPETIYYHISKIKHELRKNKLL